LFWPKGAETKEKEKEKEKEREGERERQRYRDREAQRALLAKFESQSEGQLCGTVAERRSRTA